MTGGSWDDDIEVVIEGTNCEDMCRETCQHSSDGACDDGGPGSGNSLCDLGTDCADCGARFPEANDCYFDGGGGSELYKSLGAGNL